MYLQTKTYLEKHLTSKTYMSDKKITHLTMCFNNRRTIREGYTCIVTHVLLHMYCYTCIVTHVLLHMYCYTCIVTHVLLVYYCVLDSCTLFAHQLC